MPDLFATELAQVADLIAVNPNIGVTYTTTSGRPAKRVLMPKTRNHLYFEVDEDLNRVIVLAIWGAPRGRGPAL